MAQKVKISVRKVIQALLTLVLASTCLVAIISSSKIENNKNIARVEVHIKSEKLYHFVEEKQILDEAINNRNLDVQNTPIGKLDVNAMEQVLREDPWVDDAQVYIDNNRVLNIAITQRIPIARIFDRTGNSYYIDHTLNVMPLSEKFKYYTSVVTNTPVINSDSFGTWMKAQIAAMVETIKADSFWNAQVSQVIVDTDNSFQLMPVIGQQRIIFGDTSRMKEKFKNIHTFYVKVLNKIGWDRYETIDVRFKNQVVASPSLPYIGIEDKAIKADNMSWVMSFEKTYAREDSVKKDKALKQGDEENHVKPIAAKMAAQPAKKDPKSKDRHVAAKSGHAEGKKEPAKKEPAKKEPTKKEPAKKEPAKKEPSKEQPKGKPDHHDDKGHHDDKKAPAGKADSKDKEKSKDSKNDKKPAKYIYPDDKNN